MKEIGKIEKTGDTSATPSTTSTVLSTSPLRAGLSASVGEIGKNDNNRLHEMCDRLSPKKRLIIVIVFMILFAALAVYMAVSAFKSSETKLSIKHIEGLKLQQPDKNSINNIKTGSHDYNDEQ